MATFSSPRAYANAIARGQAVSEAAMVQAARKETQEIAERYAQAAISLTSGGVSSKTLKQIGHPYARRHSTLSLGLLPINRQTGFLQESLQLYVTRSSSTAWDIRLVDAAPYAKYQLSPFNTGTRTMKPRGFWDALEAKMTIYFVGRTVDPLHYEAVKSAMGG